MTAVELRVHGVGGSTPEQLLDSGPARRVAGDADSGFYVASDPDLEAYCWGNLTSGAASRALWLLMLPFTLVNASFWMGPRRAVNEALVRLLSLSLTATFVLSAEGVGTDLLGWQCAAQRGCRERHTWLRWLGHGFLATPGRRIAVGALVPLGALLLLWILARRTAKYERAEPHVPGGPLPLEDPTFWYGERQVARLRQLHVAVGFAVISLGMSWPLHKLGCDFALVLAVLSWVVMAVASIGVCQPKVVKRDTRQDPGTAWPRWLRMASGAVLAATFVEAIGYDSGEAHAGLPGYADAVTIVFLAQLVGVLLLAVSLVGHRDRKAAGKGFAQPIFSALGLLFASVFAAGLAFRAADYLDGARSPADSGLVLPDAYQWAALSLFVVVVPTAVVLVVVAVGRLLRDQRASRAAVRRDYAQPDGLDERVDAIARTRAVAGLTDPGLGWICGVTVVSFVAAIAAMVLTVFTWDTPVQSVNAGTARDLLRFGTLAGTWLVSGFAFLLIGVGYRSYRGASLRKHVGILWDLGTFWPRAAHPLAPPCYVERCLPDLTTRIAYLVRTRGAVVLSAHSQGTVIAAALVWQLPRDVLERCRLITYGSPLSRLYGRMYSSWFGPEELTGLQERIGDGRWVNLFRTTDWIGGPVHAEADQQVLRDPPLLGTADGDPAFEKPHGHFDYELTDDYRDALARMRADL